MGGPLMPTLRLSPRQLDAFVAVADLSSFSQAATRLHLSVSAVSNLINELEDAIGFPLFERTTRKVALSSSGREFLPSVISARRHLNLAAIAATDLKNRAAEVIRIAAPLVVASVILPAAIAAYRREHPRVTIRIVDTAVEWLTDRIIMGDADLAVGPDRVAPDGLICQKLFPSPWVLWCSPEHPLAQQSVIKWEDLRGIELCAAGRDHEQSVDQMNSNLPASRRIEPTQVVDNISTALGLAATALSVTCAPAYVEPLARPLGLVMRRIVEPEVIRHVALYGANQQIRSGATHAFAQFLRERLADYR